MAVYRRDPPNGPWWVCFRIGGKTVRCSAKTTDRDQAEEYEQALRNRYWRAAKLGEEVHLWGDAVERYMREGRWRPNTVAANKRALEHFERIDHLPIAEITVHTVSSARRYVEEQIDDKGRRLGPASVVRVMSQMRAVLRRCEAWGWLKHAPKVEMPHVQERDATWLTPEQCVTLVLELPTHLRLPFIISILTGLRMSNLRDLTWGQVHLDRGLIIIASSHYKTKRQHSVALDVTAVKILEGLPRLTGIDRVFTYQPKTKDGRLPARPISGTFNTKAFRKARKRAGVTVRWHDLRHTFASWLALAGASDRVLQAMCGWASPAMAPRYAHLRAGDLRSWASAVGTNLGTAISAMESAAKISEDKQRVMVPSHRIELWTPSLRNLRAIKGDKDNQ